jgi:hypothetical protein
MTSGTSNGSPENGLNRSMPERISTAKRTNTTSPLRRQGKMYFSSNIGDKESTNNFDIYSSAVSCRESLSLPSRLAAGVNSPHYEADVFVAPDESYLVFAANQAGGPRKWRLCM